MDSPEELTALSANKTASLKLSRASPMQPESKQVQPIIIIDKYFIKNLKKTNIKMQKSKTIYKLYLKYVILKVIIKLLRSEYICKI